MTHNPDSRRQNSQFISRYELIEELGRGGLGVVYRSFDPKLGKMVAVKTLQKGNASDEQIMRFQLEAKALSALRHVSIPEVYNFAIDDEGNPYLVMEYVEGKSVADLIAESGMLSCEKILFVMNELCDVLAFAHNHGVVHRDIKPQNIRTYEDESGDCYLKLIDFGIAKLDSMQKDITKAGMIVGSPLYMSPEQLRGQKVDGRSDIYSLGCAVFQMATGSPPFRSESSVTLAMMHLSDEPPLFKEISNINNKVLALEPLIRKCLCKNPDDRFQSMEELKTALGKLSWADTAFDTALEEKELSTKKSTARMTWQQPAVYAGMVLLLVFAGLLLHFLSGKDEPFPVSWNKPTKIISQKTEYAGLVKMLDSERWNVMLLDGQKFYNSPPDASDDFLKELIPIRDLKHVQIQGSRLTGEGFKYIKDKPVRTIYVASPVYSDQGMKNLCAIETLNTISLSESDRLTEEGMEQLLNRPALTNISFNALRLPPNTMTVLSQLENLGYLGINSSECLDKKQLPMLINMKKLRSLVLRNMNIGDEDCSTLGKLSQLLKLELKNNNVTDAGVKRLSGLSSLIELDLTGNPIGDQSLLELSKLKRLWKLNIFNCDRLSKEAIDKFRKKLPNCAVNHDSWSD